MGPARADAELRCVWATGGEYLFGRAELDAVTADYLAAGLAGLEGPASVAAGLDLATTRDRAALVAAGRIPVPPSIPCSPSVLRTVGPSERRCSRRAAACSARSPRLPVPLDWLCVDSTGMQGGSCRHLAPLIRAVRVRSAAACPRRVVVLETMWDGSERTMAHDGHGQLVPYRPPRREDRRRATDLRACRSPRR